jgi:hypothetical protein
MRRERHHNVARNSTAKIFYGECVRPCSLSNLSAGGASITEVNAYTFPGEFMLRVTPHDRIRKCQVLWRTADQLGVRFVDWDPVPATPIVPTTPILELDLVREPHAYKRQLFPDMR